MSRVPIHAVGSAVRTDAVGSVPVAVGGTRVVWIVVPRPAAHHTATATTAILLQPRPPIVRCPLVATVPAVFGPLPDIAVHVVQPPLVGAEATHRRGHPIIPFAATAVTVGEISICNVVTAIRLW